MKFKNWVTIISIIAFSTSCKTVLFSNKDMVVQKRTGVLVFIDDSLRKFRNQSGDVFTDSLLPDFFIPYKFKSKPVSKSEIERVLENNRSLEVSFVAIRGDCNGSTRNSELKESTKYYLDKEVDDYVGTKRVYLLPVVIDYLPGYADFDYLLIRKYLNIYPNNQITKLSFKSGYLDLLAINTLEYEWPSVFK